MNPKNKERDSHGLRVNISDIILFDKKRRETLSSDDPFVEFVDIHAGEIYNETELREKVQESFRHFQTHQLELKTNSDGTITIKISFEEFNWEYSNKFRCISVGLLPKPEEDDTQYKRRIVRSKPCVLPDSEQKKMLEVLKKYEKTGSRSLLEIKERVEKWYKNNGYVAARVVCFGNLNTNEVVCEVVEGDITRMEFQFQDEVGNVINRDTELLLINKEIPKQLCVGQIFNMKHAKQATKNLISSDRFSRVKIERLQDDETGGGVLLQFVFSFL